MIYNSLDLLPYKTFVKIEEDDSYWRLKSGAISEKDLNTSELRICSEIWEKLYEEHLSRNQSPESKKIFKLQKNISHFIALNKIVLMGCAILKFDYNKEVHEILKSQGFRLSMDSTESYYKSLDQIEKEANNYIVKAEYYINMLPKEDEEKKEKKQEFTVDDVLAAYSAVLGFDLGDFNTVSYNKYFAYHKQVEAKISSIKKQSNTDNHGKR